MGKTQYKILFINDTSCFSGGADTLLFSLLKSLDKNRFTINVTVPSRGNISERLQELGCGVERIRLPSMRKINGVPLWIPTIYRLSQLIRREEINLIHAYSFWKLPFAYAASRLTGIPCVVHVLNQEDPLRISQYWLKKADKIIFISSAVQQYFIKMGIPLEKAITIPVGIDLDSVPHTIDGFLTRKQFGIRLKDPVIGCVARLVPSKGYEYLISALALIKKKMPHIKCFIIGTGDEEYIRMLQQSVEKMSLSANVIFTGFVKDIYPYLSAMDVFVMATLAEGFGIAFAEAMAVGKPVVGTSVGGVPEVIQDGVTGFVVPPRDPPKLADRVLELLNNSILRERMGNAGHKRIRERFTLDFSGKRLEELYLTLLS